MEKTPFKHCPKCHNKYAQRDNHDVCNLCLEDDHDEENCESCKVFVPKTLRTRRRQRIAHRAMQGGSPHRHKLADMGLSSDEEETEMAEDISEGSEEEVQGLEPRSSQKTSEDDGQQATHKVKAFKITPQKDHRSEKTMATPKASTVVQPSTSKGSTPVSRPIQKEPQGPSPQDTEAGKPSRPTPKRGQEKERERLDADSSKQKRLDAENLDAEEGR